MSTTAFSFCFRPTLKLETPLLEPQGHLGKFAQQAVLDLDLPCSSLIVKRCFSRSCFTVKLLLELGVQQELQLKKYNFLNVFVLDKNDFKAMFTKRHS